MKLLALFIVLVASNVSPIQAKQKISPSDSPLFLNGMTTDLNAGAPKVLAKRFENKTLKEIEKRMEEAEEKRKAEENRKKQEEQREAAEREEKKKAEERERKRQLTQEQRDAEKVAEQRKAAEREEKKKAKERAAAEKARCDAGQGVVNFYPGEQDKVLDWINHQFVFRTTPYCYRNSYLRGAGITPETKCAGGREKIGALCYKRCPAGYSRELASPPFSCIKKCPRGYSKLAGGGCTIEKAQRKCDWHCKQGWRDVGGALPCRKNGTALLNAKTCYCPDKYNNMGANCQIDPKYQTLSMPHAGGISAQGQYTKNHPTLGPSCKSNRELHAGMCYNKCRANYHGLAANCWQNCQRGMVECAAGCANSTQSCVMSTLNQVMSVALVASSIYAKFAEAYPATKAASEMSTFERAMADFITALTNFTKNNPQTVSNFESLKQAGSYGPAVYNAITNLYNAAGDNPLSDIIDGDDYAALVKVIDPGSPAYAQLTQSWVAHYIQITLVNYGIQIGTTFLAAVDETGIVFLVDSYAKPKCTVPKPFPLVRRKPKGCP